MGKREQNMEVIEENFDLSLKEKATPPGVSHFFGHGKLLTGSTLSWRVHKH